MTTERPPKPPDDQARCLPEPVLRGILKQVPEDFRVEEVLGFDPEGAGSHALFWVEKTGFTTPQMIGKLSRLAKVHERDIGFCGLKDKQAITRQWISMPLGPDDPIWLDELPEGIRILSWARHPKKLRRGIHQGNHFTLTVRNVQGDDPEFAQRLAELDTQGFANYFAEQRFGTDARNLDLIAQIGATSAARSGSVSRSDRNWGISTLRAVIFNAVLSQRIAAGTVSVAQAGDLAQLAGSHSRFLITDEERAHAQQRLVERDIWLTGPLWGAEETLARGQIQLDEARIAGDMLTRYGQESWQHHLTEWRVEQDRRPLMAPVSNLAAVFQPDESGQTTLEISFTLNSGSYATALLRELVVLETG